MNSSTMINRRKLLIVDINFNEIKQNEMEEYFRKNSSFLSIEFFVESSSAIVEFRDSSTVDELVENSPNFSFGQSSVRFRRVRPDSVCPNLDCFSLLVQLVGENRQNFSFDEQNLRRIFSNFQTNIRSLDLIDKSRALIHFRQYDVVDKILLQTNGFYRFQRENEIRIERIFTKARRKSRWDQGATRPFSHLQHPAERNPLVYRLMSHIEFLTKELHGRKTENRSNQVLKDVSNRRQRSPTTEKVNKRRRRAEFDSENISSNH